MPYNCFKNIKISEIEIEKKNGNEKVVRSVNEKEEKLMEKQDVKEVEKISVQVTNVNTTESKKEIKTRSLSPVLTNSTSAFKSTDTPIPSESKTEKTEKTEKTKITEISLEWYIGGSVTVDATWLSFHTPPRSHYNSIKESTTTSTSSASSSTFSTTSLNLFGADWSIFLKEIDTPTSVPFPPQTEIKPTRKTQSNKSKNKKTRILQDEIVESARSGIINSELAGTASQIRLDDTVNLAIKPEKASSILKGKSVISSGGVNNTNTNNNTNNSGSISEEADRRSVVVNGSVSTGATGSVSVSNDNSNSNSNSNNNININNNDKKTQQINSDLNKLIPDQGPVPASYAQQGDGRWAGGKNPSAPQIFSAVVKIEGIINSNVNIIKNEKNGRKNRNNLDQTNYIIPNIIQLIPGIYYLIAWSSVDSSWGGENQGFGSKVPESYLANGRTNTGWKSKQNENDEYFKNDKITRVLNDDKYKNKESQQQQQRKLKQKLSQKKKNFRSLLENEKNEKNEKKSSSREEFEKIKGRAVFGRKYWPSDPIIIEVKKDGKIVLINSVLKCSYWDRKNENKLSLDFDKIDFYKNNFQNNDTNIFNNSNLSSQTNFTNPINITNLINATNVTNVTINTTNSKVSINLMNSTNIKNVTNLENNIIDIDEFDKEFSRLYPLPNTDSMDQKITIIDSKQSNNVDYITKFEYYYLMYFPRKIFFGFGLFIILLILICFIRNFRRCFLNFGGPGSGSGPGSGISSRSRRRESAINSRVRLTNLRK